MLSIDDVHAAAARIRGVVHHTPVMTCGAIDDVAGARVHLKCEQFQRVGAFKFRGAYNRISSCTPQERARGVIALSSGNHAQATALAARLCGLPATILMPADAPASKIAATRGYGAHVEFFERGAVDMDELLRDEAAARELTLIHPYEDWMVMAGQGTVGLELVEQVPALDVLVVCTGGGGLLAGAGFAATSLLPQLRLVAVEPEASDDWSRSFAAGERVHIGRVGPTIADGQMLPVPGEHTWSVASPLLHDAVTVTDEEIRTAMRLLFERAKLVVEPSGASALAAVLAGKVDVAGRTVGVTLSGGNVSVERFAELLGENCLVR